MSKRKTHNYECIANAIIDKFSKGLITKATIHKLFGYDIKDKINYSVLKDRLNNELKAEGYFLEVVMGGGFTLKNIPKTAPPVHATALPKREETQLLRGHDVKIEKIKEALAEFPKAEKPRLKDVAPAAHDGSGEFIDELKPDQIKIEQYLTEGQMKTFMHERICKELNDLYARKNHDYGDSFGETYRKLGVISAVTRITDKINRLQSLCTKEQMVKDESIRDTLRDAANYCIMTIIEMEAQG
jgi:hypothetical protein